MTDTRKPYRLMGFRIDRAGKAFAALAPDRGMLDGAKAKEVPCPASILKRSGAEQECWARRQALSHNFLS